MENQEIKIGFGENGEGDYESEIIIRDSFKKGFRTLTVEDNGKTYYQQTRHIVCLHKGTETFLDKFLQRFNSTYEESEDLKQLDNVGYVGETNEDVTRKVAETLLKIAVSLPLTFLSFIAFMVKFTVLVLIVLFIFIYLQR